MSSQEMTSLAKVEIIKAMYFDTLSICGKMNTLVVIKKVIIRWLFHISYASVTKPKKKKKKKEKENGKILRSTVLLIFIKVILSKGKMEITGFCSKQNS